MTSECEKTDMKANMSPSQLIKKKMGEGGMGGGECLVQHQAFLTLHSQLLSKII